MTCGAAQLILMYTLSNSRQNFDLKYQMPKHDMHVNLLICTKVFLFICEKNRCRGQRTRKASWRSTNHSLPWIICWVSENHRHSLFRAISWLLFLIETKDAAPFSGSFLSFSHLPIFRSHEGHSISLVYL